MEIFNTVFSNFRELQNFIESHIKQDETLLQIFSGYLNEEFIRNLITFLNQYPNIKFIGTTTAGEIIENAIVDNRVVLSFAVFKKSKIKIVSISSKDLEESGAKLASFSKNGKLVIAYVGGIGGNASDFIRSYFNNSDVPLVGGLAGDNLNFIHSYIFSKDGVFKEGVVGAVIEGEVYVNILRSFGWKTIGKKFNITKAYKNVIYEIDNTNVLAYLERYLGKEYVDTLPYSSTEIPFYCSSSENNLRIVTQFDKASITLNAGVFSGGNLQVAIPDADYFASFIKAIQKLIAQISIEGVFIYGNVTKKIALKDEFEKELSVISPQTNVSGFFGYGEFGYLEYEKKERCDFENGGVLFVFISEENSYHKIFKNFKVKTDYKYLTKRPALFIKESFGHFINSITKELMETNEKLRQKIEEVLEENIKSNLIIQQQSKQAQLGEMISMIAHQWKQPLNVVSLYVENMMLSLKMFEEVNKEECINTCNKIKNEVKRMNEIINNFSQFAKPETKPKIFYVNDSLKKAINLVSAQFESKGIKIRSNCSYSIKIEGYETLLEQVFINILINSRDAFEENKIENPYIKIECKYENGYFILIFEDNGGGIPNDLLEKIFTPYFTTKGTKGTGLGLYMAKKIMREKFDGDIDVEVEEDKTRFYVKIGPYVLR